MAPTLPAGVVGPSRFSLAGDGAEDVNFVVVRGTTATRYFGNGAAVIVFARSALGLSSEPVLDASVLSALRASLQRAGVDASRVSATQLDRETIRALLWWAFVRGTADEGTPATRVWLPGGTLTVPSLGSRVPGSTTAGVRSEPLRPTAGASNTGGNTGGGARNTGGNTGGTAGTPSQAGVLGGLGMGMVGLALAGGALLGGAALFSRYEAREGSTMTRPAPRRREDGAPTPPRRDVPPRPYGGNANDSPPASFAATRNRLAKRRRQGA